MGMPSFDYNSLNAPGGIAQGLGAIGASLIDARAQRRRQEQQQAQQQAQLEFQRQGLAQVREQNLENNTFRNAQLAETNRGHLENATFRNAQLAETNRSNLANEANAADRYSSMGAVRQKTPEELAYLQAQTDQAVANTERLRRPERERWDPSQLSADASVKAEAEAAAYADEQMAIAGRLPENRGTPGGSMPWSAGPTPARDLSDFRETARQNRRGELGLGRFAPAQTAPAPAPAAVGDLRAPAPAAVGDLRARVTNAFVGILDPDTEAALQAAEAGDAEARQQLEEHIAGFAPAGNRIAPDAGTDLLSVPTR